MEYRFLDRGDETLIEASELPVEGIAVAVRTTGYGDGDEVVELAIADLDGNELFSRRVKPQNVGAWEPGDASGGIAPADVEDCPELYQFEEEVSALFENAEVVVGMHAGFARETIEASWVTLPAGRDVDLDEEFRASHCAADYPGEPATAAALDGIAAYYGTEVEPGTLGEAKAVAACYRALVDEHRRERDAKGEAHWEAYRRRLEEAELADEELQAARRRQAIRANRVNAIMWLCAAAIFSNLAVQLGIRGFDAGFVTLAAAAAVFFAVRWIMCLAAMHKLRKQG